MKSIDIVIFGNCHTRGFDITNALLQHSHINIVAGIIDHTVSAETQDQQKEFLISHKIPIVTLDELPIIKADIGFLIHYAYIIPEKHLNYFPIINLHGGVLPKWRGFNSNIWALLNGEKFLGFTLHEVNSKLDDGNIYDIYQLEIQKEARYEEHNARLRKLICEQLGDTLVGIVCGTKKPHMKNQGEFVYTTKIKHSHSIINDWGKSSEYIYNLFRIFARPYGTGLFFMKKDQKYEITKMHMLDNIPSYICVDGAVVNIDGDSIWVKTSDTLISIDEIMLDNKKIYPSSLFKMGYLLR